MVTILMKIVDDNYAIIGGSLYVYHDYGRDGMRKNAVGMISACSTYVSCDVYTEKHNIVSFEISHGMLFIYDKNEENMATGNRHVYTPFTTETKHTKRVYGRLIIVANKKEISLSHHPYKVVDETDE